MNSESRGPFEPNSILIIENGRLNTEPMSIVEPDTIVHVGVTDSEMFCPLRKAFGLAIYCRKSVRRYISSLFLGRGPATVFWGIVFPVFFSFQRMLRGWPSSHVGEKSYKSALTAPSPAYANSLQIVQMRTLVVRVSASLVHGSVAGIFRGKHPSFCVPVYGISHGPLLFKKASARFGSIMNQINRCAYLCATAIADAIPQQATSGARSGRTREGRKSSEFLFSQVKCHA